MCPIHRGLRHSIILIIQGVLQNIVKVKLELLERKYYFYDAMQNIFLNYCLPEFYLSSRHEFLDFLEDVIDAVKFTAAERTNK